MSKDIIFETSKHYNETKSLTNIVNVESPMYQLFGKNDYTKTYYDVTKNNYAICDINGQLLNFVHFQDCPISEGVNGSFMEDYLRIIKFRLDYFQHEKIPCIENVHALSCIDEALYHLRVRTNDRKARNVLGTNSI